MMFHPKPESNKRDLDEQEWSASNSEEESD